MSEWMVCSVSGSRAHSKRHVGCTSAARRQRGQISWDNQRGQEADPRGERNGSACPARPVRHGHGRSTYGEGSDSDLHNVSVQYGDVTGRQVPNPRRTDELNEQESRERCKPVHVVIASTAGTRWVVGQATSRRSLLPGEVEGTPFDHPLTQGSPSSWWAGRGGCSSPPAPATPVCPSRGKATAIKLGPAGSRHSEC